MTIDEMKRSNKPLLTAADVAPAIGMRIDYLRHTAIEAPEELPFPILRRVSPKGKISVRFPRKPILKFLGEDGAQ